jgi:hypothetical protein
MQPLRHGDAEENAEKCLFATDKNQMNTDEMQLNFVLSACI